MEVGEETTGVGGRCYMRTRPIVVAEIGINHNGDVGLAKANIGLAKGLGADYVKFQKRTVDVVYAKEDLDRPRISPWGKTNRDQKEGLEFGKAEYDQINDFCKAIGIGWFASPWDAGSLDFLLQYNPPFIKIASAMLTNADLLRVVRESGKSVIMSTAMSDEDQIDTAVAALGHQLKYILHCVATYPTDDEDVNLSRMLSLKKKYGDRCKVGFSNHSEHIIFNVAAMVLAAEMIEFHITVDRNLYGSDQKSSIGPTGFKRIMEHITRVQRGWGDGSLNPRPAEAAAAKKLRGEK